MTSTARTSLLAAGLGAGAMFLLDPARGSRRRALVRDKLVHAARKTRDAAGATRRDLANRLGGLNARLRSRFAEDRPDDVTVRERVRAELGRVSSHPRAIEVESQDCRVTLTGDVLASEVSGIVSAASSVRGVTEVQNGMTPHASAEGVSALQGTSERPDQWWTWLRSGWSPTAILVAGVGTAALAIAAGARRAA